MLPVYHLFCSIRAIGTHVLTDHGHGCILDTHANLVDDVVDPGTHAEGGGGNYAHAVDHRIDEQHRNVDEAGLDGHGRTQRGDHAGITLVEGERTNIKITTPNDLLIAELMVKNLEEKGGENL